MSTLRQRDTKYKKNLKNYHVIGRKAKKHTIKLWEEIVLKRKRQARKETPKHLNGHKAYGSTIHADRVNDKKPMCQDASKFKPTSQ